jgi:signal transduction histidine kinase
MRHAPGSAVRVELAYAPSALVIKVRNDPCAAQDGDSEAAGHGLIGMRERTGMLGGHLEAGPTEDGGFLVTAVLPDTGDREGGGR